MLTVSTLILTSFLQLVDDDDDGYEFIPAPARLPRRTRTPARTPGKSPAGAAVTRRRASVAKLKGKARDVSCLGCIKSALSGFSDGVCYHVAGSRASARCMRCSKGHQCHALPDNDIVKHMSMKLVRALADGASHATAVSFIPVIAAFHTDFCIVEAANHGQSAPEGVQFHCT